MPRGGTRAGSGRPQYRTAEESRALRRQRDRARREQLRFQLQHRRSRGLRGISAGHEALANTDAIFEGRYTVTPYSLPDRTECIHCGAQLWQYERNWSTICCRRGKVSLPFFKKYEAGTPQHIISSLWENSSEQGATLRRFARQVNNAMALASQSVKNVQPVTSGWVPSVVIQGRLYHQIGALQHEANAIPQFAQVYVLDTAYSDSAETVRLGNMNLPAQVTARERNVLIGLLRDLSTAMIHCNPYVQDIRSLSELPPAQVGQARFLLNATLRPDDQHERRYNTPQTMKEIYVLTEDENINGRSFVVHLRGGGVQRLPETHRSFDPLHYVLLFPLGEDG